MKLKTASFEGENRQIARYILRNEAKYGPDCLLARWARAVVARAPADAAPDREGQQELFAERGVA
jgi:hypothetical protein